MLTPEQRANALARMQARNSEPPKPMEFKGSLATLVVPDFPETIDTRKELTAIEKAIGKIDNSSGFESVNTALKAVSAALRAQAESIRAQADNLGKLASSITGIKIEAHVDLGPLKTATEANTAALKAMASAMKADRTLVFDDDGNPIGLTTQKVN